MGPAVCERGNSFENRSIPVVSQRAPQQIYRSALRGPQAHVGESDRRGQHRRADLENRSTPGSGPKQPDRSVLCGFGKRLGQCIRSNQHRRAVPSYEIDRIALDYCATGLLHFGSQVFDEYKTTGLDSSNDDLVLLVRMFVVTGAYCGIYLLEGQSKTAERLELTKSHFDDLQVIKTRIRRDGLERMMIRRRDGGDGNEIRDLFAAFERIDVAIDNYLKAYEPKGSKGRQSRLSFKRSHPLHIGFVVRANDL